MLADDFSPVFCATDKKKSPVYSALIIILSWNFRCTDSSRLNFAEKETNISVNAPKNALENV